MVVLNILIFTPNLGKIDQFWRAYVSNRWFNHQLVKMTTWKRCSTYFPPIFNLFLPHGSIWFHHFLRLPSSASIKSGRTGATVELHERWRNTGYLPSTRAGGHGSGWWYDDVCLFGLRHAMRHRMAWWMHDISDAIIHRSREKNKQKHKQTLRLVSWVHAWISMLQATEKLPNDDDQSTPLGTSYWPGSNWDWSAWDATLGRCWADWWCLSGIEGYL